MMLLAVAALAFTPNAPSLVALGARNAPTSGCLLLNERAALPRMSAPSGGRQTGGVPAGFLAASALVQQASAIDVGGTEVDSVVVGGGVVVLALGGGFAIYQQKQAEADKIKRAEALRRKAIKDAEFERDRLAAQVSLAVPVVIGALFFYLVSNFS